MPMCSLLALNTTSLGAKFSITVTKSKICFLSAIFVLEKGLFLLGPRMVDLSVWSYFHVLTKLVLCSRWWRVTLGKICKPGLPGHPTGGLRINAVLRLDKFASPSHRGLSLKARPPFFPQTLSNFTCSPRRGHASRFVSTPP